MELSGVENINRAMRQALTSEGDQAGTGPGLPGHHRLDDAFHRPLRDGLGDHGCLPGDRDAGLRHLAVVAPGISEALIATAAGLAAAIPAVVAYNYYINRIKVLNAQMENFASELLNIIERHFLKA